MLDAQRPAHTAGGIFHRPDAEWAAVRCAELQAVVADWLLGDRLSERATAVTDCVAAACLRTLGPRQLFAAVRLVA
ncbi:hypothetical protein ACWGJT_03285 [Streptomyces xantholiticus]